MKQYLKDGAAPRTGTVVNSPKDLRCSRQLRNLPELQDKARAVNAFPLETETAGRDTVLVSPVTGRITRPAVIGGGRKAPALRFGGLRVRALAGAIAAMLFTVPGITSRTLRGLMTGLLNRPCSMNRAGCGLSRLARNGLIERVPGRNRCTLTRDGLLFACFYTRVYDHVLRPLTAPGRPGAPPSSPPPSARSAGSSPITSAGPASPPPPDSPSPAAPAGTAGDSRARRTASSVTDSETQD